ncbi:MAG: hypothetical protein ACTHK5_01355 [Tsuneonella sp.]
MSNGQDDEAPFGVLVGWDHQDLGDRVMVRLQSTQAPGLGADKRLDEFRYFMTKNQAAVLANFLFDVSGRIKPAERKRTWLGRRSAAKAR